MLFSLFDPVCRGPRRMLADAPIPPDESSRV